MKVYSRQYLLGLLAYIRQAALSLDRATSPDFRGELRRYYEARRIPRPTEVLMSMDKNARSSSVPIVAAFLLRGVVVSSPLIERICSAIKLLEKLVSDEGDFTVEDKRSLRLELTDLENLLRRKLSRSDQANAQEIEHYNQNERLRLKSLDQIVRHEWPSGV